MAHEVPFGWVTGDSVYGDYRRIRLWLEMLPKRYVLAGSPLAGAAKEYVWIDFQQERVGDVLAQLPADHWVRLSAGDVAKGPRLYEWQRIPIIATLTEGWQRWLLVRPNLDDATDLAAFVCFAPAATPLEKLVQAAGSRRHIETAFEEAKGEVWLDPYEVRSFVGWYRHITLACLAHALLVVVRTKASASRPSVAATAPKKGPEPPPPAAGQPSGVQGSPWSLLRLSVAFVPKESARLRQYSPSSKWIISPVNTV